MGASRIVRFLTLAVVLSVCLVALSAGGAVDLASSNHDHESDDDVAPIDDELETATEPVEVIVRLEEADVPDDVPAETAEEVLEDHADETHEPIVEYAEERDAVELHAEFWLANAVLLELDPTDVDLKELAREEGVTELHPNFDVSVPDAAGATYEAGAVDDERVEPVGAETAPEVAGADRTAPSESVTDGIATINADAVWDTYGTRGEGVRIAVLDTGVDASHPDVDLRSEDPDDPTYPGGWAEFDGHGDRVPGSTPYDSGTHGTHVSGTVAGGDAGGTAIGVAPEAELMHGLVLSGQNGSFAQILAGMEWAVAEEADIVNLSLGTTGYHHQFVEPVRNLKQVETVVVAAVGNSGEGTSGSPANVYDALSVGAVSGDGTVAAFSGGERIERESWDWTPDDWPDAYVVPDVVAPGTDVESTRPGGTYGPSSGTSMATPHVSGTAALLLSVADASPDEVAAALSSTAGKPDDAPAAADTRYGEGIVDAKAAVDAVADEPPKEGGGEERPVERAIEDPGDDRSVPGSVELVALVVLVVLLAAGLDRAAGRR